MRALSAKVGARCGAIIAALVLCTFWANRGLSDPLSDVTIRWDAPADCPDRVALDQELRRDLEGSQAPSIRVHVQANVTRLDPETWRVSIRTESSAGQSERGITAHSCAALVDATSLIVAMLIDPETAATHARPIEGASVSAAPPPANPGKSANAAPASSANAPPPAANPSNSANAAPASSANAPPPIPNFQRNPVFRETQNQNPNLGSGAPVNPQTQRTSWPATGLIAAWVAGDSGSLPSFTEALGGSLGLLVGPWRAEASLGYWFPRSKHSLQPANPNAVGEFGKIAGSAELCLRVWAPSRFELSPCAGLELARLSGIGNGFLADSKAYRWVGSAQIGAVGILSLTDALALRFDLDVLLPLNRPDFGFIDQGGNSKSVFGPALVTARAGLGVELHFR